jgi:hypothetical protein
MMPLRRLAIVAACFVSGCSASAPPPTAHVAVAAAPPPKDDGKPAQGGSGGKGHAAALEQLKTAPTRPMNDRQNSVRVPLPDAEHWTRVKFWGQPSLVGFRYGKDHHAIVGGVITHVDDNTAPGACSKSFEAWAAPLLESFDVDVKHDAPSAVVWRNDIAELESVSAKTATLIDHDTYLVAYANYPAWKGACLVVGVAVPAREDEARAREVRDRFLKEVLPKVEVLSEKEPPERY